MQRQLHRGFSQAGKRVSQGIDQNRQNLGMVLGLIGVVMFGATLPMTHLGLAGFSPWFLTFARAMIASIIALAYVTLTGTGVPRGRLAETFLAGLLLVFGFPGFATLAMQSVPGKPWRRPSRCPALDDGGFRRTLRQ